MSRIRTRRALTVALTAAGLAAAASPLAAQAAPARDMNDYSRRAAHTRFFTQKPVWYAKTCQGRLKKSVCARITVPRDWARPRLGTMTILVGTRRPSPARASGCC